MNNTWKWLGYYTTQTVEVSWDYDYGDDDVCEK
jgi:hypothetical protein